MNFNLKDAFLIFIRGILMGSADIVPGVSGGTIALITGIYSHLIAAISNIRFGFIKPLLKGNLRGFVDGILDEIDFKFFIPLGLGIAIAMVTLAKVVTYCMDNYVGYTFSFFLGLIVASAIILFKKIDKINFKHVIFVVVGIILAYIFVNLNPIATNHSLPVLFISGAIAICAMILPGVSGSFLLLLLGQYGYMLDSLFSVNVSEIVVFLLGAVIGISLIIAFSRKPFSMTGTLAIMIIALAIRRMPFTSRSATAAMMKIPISVEEAALSLGAPKVSAFTKITIPMLIYFYMNHLTNPRTL